MPSPEAAPFGGCPCCGAEWFSAADMDEGHAESCVPCPECADHVLKGYQRNSLHECAYCRGWARVVASVCDTCNGDGELWGQPMGYAPSKAGYYPCPDCDGEGKTATGNATSYREDMKRRRIDGTPV